MPHPSDTLPPRSFTEKLSVAASNPKSVGLKTLLMLERIKQLVKQAKGFYSWYSFGSAIVGKLGLGGLFTTGTALVVGVAASVVKGVPWPIILMAGASTLLAGACLEHFSLRLSRRGIPESAWF
jgi:hypothetical protein